MPRELYDLTPREYGNLLTAREKQIDDDLHMRAVQAIMYRKAMNKKTLKFTDLIGKKDDKSKLTKRGDLEEKNRSMMDLERELGTPLQ